ncbi:MAG: hypothetical protein IJ727_04560 [Treponema sp.]|nr:hypothetical protein [Treponema sp.]
MKNFKKWLPILLIALVTMFLTGCKVDWTTVSATETNAFAFGAFWFLIHIVVPAVLFIAQICFIYDASENNSDRLASGVIFGIALVGVYVFHFFHLKADWFSLSCLTQLGFWTLAFTMYAVALFDDSTAESVIYSIVSTGIVIVSLLANVFTGKYLEPFVFSCAGWLSIILGSFGRKLRGDGEIGAEILSPILCFAAMIFALVHTSVPHYLYMIAIHCAIATIFALLLIMKTEGMAYVVLISSYIWVFIAANLYNPEKFGKSLAVSLIGWGALFVITAVLAILAQKKNIEKANRLAAYNAQKAKERAKKKAEEEATAKIIAEEKAKMKAEAEAKAKQEAEEKAEAEAKAKAEAEAKAKAEAEAKAKAEAEEKAKKLAETKAILSQLESDLAAKKAEVASLGLDAQGIVQKAKLNKEIKELEPQIETLKAEVERLSK